jgi:hypothetical protein
MKINTSVHSRRTNLYKNLKAVKKVRENNVRIIILYISPIPGSTPP